MFLCLQAYLRPYKDRLVRLIGEKTFRDEMTAFTLDADSGIVLREHRAAFVPILIRIMFPKLVQRKTTQAKVRSRLLVCCRCLFI